MAPRKNETNEKKIALLNFIKSKKSILFGRFSSDLDNREKTAAWNEVVVKAKSLGLAAAERDVQFVRDKMWGVWKSRTMEKRDNKRQTGSGGGKEKVLGEIDLIILEIIGPETVVVEGLPIPESGRVVPATSTQPPLDTDEVDDNYKNIKEIVI